MTSEERWYDGTAPTSRRRRWWPRRKPRGPVTPAQVWCCVRTNRAITLDYLDSIRRKLEGRR